MMRTELMKEDVAKAANSQTATLIRKSPHESRAILEISVDDSKMRVTPSHRVLTPKDGSHVVLDVQRSRLVLRKKSIESRRTRTREIEGEK